MPEASDDIVRRLAAGESLDEIGRSLRPPGWRPLLRACAVARVFNSALFEGVLRPYAAQQVTDVPGLEELLAARAVEAVGDGIGTFALPEADRFAYFLEWFGPADADEDRDEDGAGDDREQAQVPAELARLERLIADFRHAADDHGEELRHLLLPEPDLALDLFHALFTAADERRDFAACQDLVDTLGDPDRLPLARPEIDRLRLDRAGYVRARAYWAADYARSAQFLQPPDLERDTERLLSGEDRVWQMYAPGGTGKTMRLRWLVARHCVPAERDVLCARIDFDVINPVAAGGHPWLLLLEVAEQFGRRLPGRPFARLDEYAAYRVLLDRRASDATRGAAQNIGRLDRDTVEQEVLDVFATRLNLARVDGPVNAESPDGPEDVPAPPAVLVLDTLEEVLLRGQDDMARLLDLLQQLLNRCPGLRIVLAGRYDLRERAPEALRRLAGHKIRHIEVRPFDEPQSLAYLTEIRGIAEPELAAIAARKSGGLPFSLALFADLIEHDPDIEPAELAACEEPLVRYLIDRVVRRIEDPMVRWLLRYGVIPRRLRFEDVKTVMRAWLVQGITGTRSADDPREDRHHLHGREDLFPFDPSGLTDEQLEHAWKRLLDYAGSSSWVSKPTGDDSMVVFHTNVLAPMRQLISDHPVFVELHKDFVKHFDALAAADPDQWVAYTREAVYHRFQAGESDAEDFWVSAVGDPVDERAAERARALSEEILGDEYVDEDEPRQGRDGELLISHQAIATAHLVIAYSLLRLADLRSLNAADPAWGEIDRRIASVDGLRRRGVIEDVTRGFEAVLRANFLRAHGRHEEALHVTETALAAESDGEWRQLLQTTLARLHADLGSADAEASYRGALLTAHERGDRHRAAELALEYADELSEQRRFDEAADWHASARSYEAPDAVHFNAVLREARTHLATFAPTAALRTLSMSGTREPGPAEACEAELLRSEAHWLLGRSRPALAALERAESLNDDHSPTPIQQSALISLADARVRGDLLDLELAEVSYGRAIAMENRLGFPHASPELLLNYARFLARGIGDLRRAADTLEQLKAVGALGKLEIPAALLWHELAHKGYTGLRNRPLPDITCTTDSELLAGGVAAALVEPGYAGELARVLEHVQPPAARLAVLEGLSEWPVPSPSVQAELAVLRPLFEPIAEPDMSPDPDRSLRLAMRARLDRMTGDDERAAHFTRVGFQALCEAGDDDPLALWRSAKASLSLGARPGPELATRLVRAADPSAPLLSAVARQLLAATETDVGRARALLIEAAAPVGEILTPSIWEVGLLRSVAEINEDPSTMAAAHRMAERLGLPAEPGPASGELSPPGFGVPVTDRRRVQGPRDAGMSRPDDTGAFTPMPVLPTPGSDPVISLESLSAFDRDLDARRLAADLLADRRTVLAYMAEAMEATSPVPMQDVVRLEAEAAPVHALPWELLAAPGETPYRTLPAAATVMDVRTLQATLNASAGSRLATDGIWGMVTQQALKAAVETALLGPVGALTIGLSTVAVEVVLRARARSAARRRPPTAWLLRPFEEGTTSSRHGNDGPERVSRAYSRNRFNMIATDILEQLSASSPPVVVHIAAPLRLIGQVPHFDLAPAHDTLGTRAHVPDIGPSQVADMLARFEPGSTPLVVLDPPFLGSPADIPYQLVLRNLFAAHLFASGTAPAVLGTGLAREPHGKLDALAGGLVHNRPLLDIVRELRAEGYSGGSELLEKARWGDDRLAAACTALFATPSVLHADEVAPS
ncbi:hypothetical protein AB0D57_05990 [Streptomyces sp. NPDC048275]|uniref:hypothetical protein n=1 Tax=Streptomyces sp. NPDC048275 TaxID=3155629 RepID=UPI0033F6A991